jgi:hypothetical protein
MRFLVLVALATVLSCVYVSEAQREVPWDDLRIKWDVNIFDENTFRQYPLTQADAVSQGFDAVDAEGAACEDGLPGSRYATDGDLTTIVVYDANGFIAGVQMAISQSDAAANGGGYPFDQMSAFRPQTIDGVDYWVLAAYFVEPSVVCVGRTQEEFEESGTGTGLYIMTGPELTDYENPANTEGEVGSSEWVHGYCFLSMGEHYWYNVSEDLPCDEMFPAFLLYNQGELTGFGWAVQGIYQSDHTEYPPSFVLNLFINPIPTCLPGIVDDIGVTTQHIYFNVGLTTVNC